MPDKLHTHSAQSTYKHRSGATKAATINEKSHLHVQDDLIVGREVGLGGLAGGGVEVVKANTRVGVHKEWHRGCLGLDRTRAMVVRMQPA